MSQVDKIVFVDAPRGTPDRGWDCDAVRQVLERSDVHCRLIYVTSASELRKETAFSDCSLYWPLSYTFNGDPESTLITSVLEELSCPYAGCNPNGLRLTNKLLFKAALISASLPVPAHQLINPHENSLDSLPYPGFLKSEYSCDSQGVRLVNNSAATRSALTQLQPIFPQRFYLESLGGTTEWTIGCIKTSTGFSCASIGLQAAGRSYIDSVAKSDNSLLRLSIPDQAQSEHLADYTSKLATLLDLDGYFRIDVLTGFEDIIYPIDLNLLPHLNAPPKNLSYLPMSFMLRTGCSFEDVITAVVASATHRWPAIPGSALAVFAAPSRLKINP